jgi:hypothetical protein
MSLRDNVSSTSADEVVTLGNGDTYRWSHVGRVMCGISLSIFGNTFFHPRRCQLSFFRFERYMYLASNKSGARGVR